MSKVKPHILFFVFWLITLCISYVLNIGFMGTFFGSLIAVITDPMVLIFGILCGLLFSDIRKFLFAFCLSAVAVNLIVEYSLLDFHSEIGHSKTTIDLFFTVFVRTIALLILAVSSNMIRLNILLFAEKKVFLKKILNSNSNSRISFILFLSIFLICSSLFFYYIPLTSKKMICEGEKILVGKASYQSYFPKFSHDSCPPTIINGIATQDIDCLNTQKISEEFTSKSIFSGSIIFNEYIKFFGFSLWLIDANEKNNVLTNFSRDECKFVSSKKVICSNKFDGDTANVDFDITSLKLAANVDKDLRGKIYYDLKCNKLSEN